MSDKQKCGRCGAKMDECPVCKGKGRRNIGTLADHWITCSHCNGTGYMCPKHGKDR